MKKKWTKVMAVMLALLTFLGSVFTTPGEALAASSTASLQLWYASAREHEVITEFNTATYTGDIMYAMIDGSVAYCMNFTESADGGQSMKGDHTPETSLTAAQEKLLGYCMYYGFNTDKVQAPSEAQKNKYIATQAMVWIIVKGLFGKPKADSAARKLCDCAPGPDDAYEYYEKLRDKIDAAYNVIVPSFASTTKSKATVYELEWNGTNNRYEITLRDENKVLEDFDFEIDGYHTSRSGNKLTIYTTTPKTSSSLVTGTSNIGVVKETSSCLYWTIDKDDYQEFISSRPQADPINAYLKVKTQGLGYGRLVKRDKDSGKPLGGGVFGIYADSACQTLLDTLTTADDGSATSKALTPGTYYVKEIKAPYGYALNPTVYPLNVVAGQTASLVLDNKGQKVSLIIYKEGEAVVSWEGEFSYEKQGLEDVTFRLTAAEDIYGSDGTFVYAKGDVVRDNLTTKNGGAITVEDLYYGAYWITEVSGAYGHVLDTTPVKVTLQQESQTKEVEIFTKLISNKRQKANVKVVKKDEETNHPLSGGQFGLFAEEDILDIEGKVVVSKGVMLEKVTTDDKGEATFHSDLPTGYHYAVKEVMAPKGYWRNTEDVYTFFFDGSDTSVETAVFSHVFQNRRTRAEISVQKVDLETNQGVPQGQATLEGAVYGVYAKEDIYHPDGQTGLVYPKGELVATLITDKYGYAEVKGLYLGSYYVKEIRASEGYELDETEYDMNCIYEGDQKDVVRTCFSKEKIISRPVQLIKISDDGTSTEAELLKGAGFRAYYKSELSKKADGSYDFESASPVVIGENGERELFTDEKGYLCTRALPYGVYIFVESTTPKDLQPVKPFEVAIRESGKMMVWRVFVDREFTAKLRIVKKDANTGESILRAGAEFKIFDLKKQEYVSMITTYPSKEEHTSFVTDEDGDLILPHALSMGNYRIEEVAAPYGYLRSEDVVEVQISSDTFYEVDGDTNDAIITVEFFNIPVVGRLVIEKKDASEEKWLPGATFHVYAGEDIYRPDNHQICCYKKGDLVATLTTNEEGRIVITDLPLGIYEVIEIAAPTGYLLNAEKQTVTLSYLDDETPVVEEQITVHNERIPKEPDKPEKPKKPKKPKEPETPKTGDESNFWIWILLGGAALGSIGLIRTEKRNKGTAK